MLPVLSYSTSKYRFIYPVMSDNLNALHTSRHSINLFPIEYLMLHQQVVVSSYSIMSVSFDALLHIPLIDTIMHLHLIQQALKQDGLVYTNFHTF